MVKSTLSAIRRYVKKLYRVKRHKTTKPRKCIFKVTPRPPLRIKLLSKEATLPTRGSKEAAGYDLYSSQAVVIPACHRLLVPTDISIGIPTGCYGRIAPRSGLAQQGIDVGAGVIDRDYTGPIRILVINASKIDYTVNAGARIAQLILERIITPEVVEVKDLKDTDRGEGGFGSTGI